MTPNDHRWRDRLGWAWLGVILLLCWLPAGWLPEPESASGSASVPHHTDKLVHFSMFLIYSLVWLRGRPARARYGWVVAGGLVLAALSELGQGAPIIDRDPDALDVAADACGVVLGAGLAWVVSRLRREPR